MLENWIWRWLLESCLFMREMSWEASSRAKLCQPLELNLEKLNPSELSKSLIIFR